MSEADRQSIDTAARLLRERFPVDKIVLFGSKATGRADKESDIDLLVLTARALSWSERAEITNALFDVQLTFDVVISTLVVPTAEWETGAWSVMPIHDEVERHGVAA